DRAPVQRPQVVPALESGAERHRQAAAVHPEGRREHLSALHRKRRVVRREEIGEDGHENQAAEDDDRDQRSFAHRFDDSAEPARSRSSCREPCVGRDSGHRYLLSLILVSMKAYRMSTTRLMPTIMKPAMITTPCTSGKSRWKMPSYSSRPLPGQAKIKRIMMAALTITPTLTPAS